MGAKVDVMNSVRKTPLHIAAENGRVDIAELLLDRGAEVNAKIGAWVPLHGAAYKGKTDVARLLLDRGADPNVGNENGRTPLHHAATKSRTGFAKLLLDRGADPNVGSKEGWTPLQHAVYDARTDTAKLLIQHGADPLKAFEDPLEILDFFKGDIDRWPDGPMKAKLLRMQRGKQAFGM